MTWWGNKSLALKYSELEVLNKAKKFLNYYKKIALEKYSKVSDQLPLITATPKYSPPIVHFSPSPGGIFDSYLMGLSEQELQKIARNWVNSSSKEVIPPQLLEDILNDDCVIFLGAGASTEGTFSKPRLTDIIAEKCSYPKNKKSLPLVSQYFCAQMDGGQKGRLVRLIRNVIDNYMKNGEEYRTVTMCHTIVAKIPQLRVIVTTNWDVFMERLLNVIAVVNDEDMVYWSSKDRQVIKMHGCITQPATMVITKNDYNVFLSERLHSPIINKISDLMATKTFLFLGYSLRDPDFEVLHKRILSQIGSFARHSYAVMLDPNVHTISKWKKKNVTIIPCSGLDFLRKLQDILVQKGIIFSDYNLDRLHDQLEALRGVHSITSQRTGEIGKLSAIYQDGLQHGLEGVINQIKWGTTKTKIQNELQKTKKNLQKDDQKSKDTAYWSGRVHSLKFALKQTNRDLDLFFSAKKLIPINKSTFIDESKEDLDYKFFM